MNSDDDLVFKGQREVIVLGGRHIFALQGRGTDASEVFLAGGYRDAVPASQIETSRIADLNGQFALLRHDPKSHVLRVAIDRFGFFPLFFTVAANRLYLSSSLRAFVDLDIVTPETETDFAALSDILAFNVPFDRRTPLCGVSAITGGTELTIDLNTLDLQTDRIWNPVDLLRKADLHFDDVRDRLVTLFQQGVEQAIANQERVAITLSGGADSRCLLAAALVTGVPISTYSTGVPGSRAGVYAQRMAQLCGVPHTSSPLDEEFVRNFPTLMEQSIMAMDGMSFSSEVEAAWLREHVPRGGVLLHGAFAELFKIGKMHNFHFDKAMALVPEKELSQRIWERFSTRYRLRSEGFCPAYRERLNEQARSALDEKVRRYQRELDTAGVLQMLYVDEFLGKVARSSRMMWAQRIPVAFPFAFPPLIDLMLQVKTDEKIDNRFVAYLLKKINHLLARFPDSNTGVPIGSSRLRREATHVLDWSTKKLLGSNARADHQDFSHWLSGTRPGIEAVFERLQRQLKIFDMNQIQRLTDRCRSGDDLASRTLQFLWGWGLWALEVAQGRKEPKRSGLDASGMPALAE